MNNLIRILPDIWIDPTDVKAVTKGFSGYRILFKSGEFIDITIDLEGFQNFDNYMKFFEIVTH